jgi:actin-related protein
LFFKKKETVKAGEPAKFVRHNDLPGLTDSYKRYMLKETLLDFSINVLQISDTIYNKNEISALPRVSYEFPNGYNTDFGEERFYIPEGLFNPSILKEIQPNSMLDVVHLITNSINMCDPELRSSFFSNIMIVGGNSMITGFIDRLNYEFNHLNYKTKIAAAPSITERRYSSWIGGSILGSLGTFHQMWISKQEYEETGKFIIDKKSI